MPGLNDLYPNGLGWVLTVLVMGALMTVVAAYGYKVVAHREHCGAVDGARLHCYGIVAARQLGIDSVESFWPKAKELIWTAANRWWPREVHVLARHVLRLFCNMATHIGMRTQPAPLRAQVVVRRGLGSRHVSRPLHRVAVGLDPVCATAPRDAGHTDVLPGPLAYNSAGVAGVLASCRRLDDGEPPSTGRPRVPGDGTEVVAVSRDAPDRPLATIAGCSRPSR